MGGSTGRPLGAPCRAALGGTPPPLFLAQMLGKCEFSRGKSGGPGSWSTEFRGGGQKDQLGRWFARPPQAPPPPPRKVSKPLVKRWEKLDFLRAPRATWRSWGSFAGHFAGHLEFRSRGRALGPERGTRVREFARKRGGKPLQNASKPESLPWATLVGKQ